METALTELTRNLKSLELSFQPISDSDKATFDKYPKLFANLPLQYKKTILEYFEKQDLLKNPAVNIEDEMMRLLNVYLALGNHFKIQIQFNWRQGYIYFDREHVLLHGYASGGPKFMQFDKDGKLKSWTEEQKKDAAQIYKIHLMPKPDDMPVILIRVLEEVQKNPTFANLIAYFKIKYNLKELKDNYGQTLPVMVLYPSNGKDNAQQLLNIVYSLFKDMQGLDITPRYNQKVTDLIYFAQGNADDKNDSLRLITGKSDPNWATFDYYEQPDMIYFKPDFVTPGQFVDYHLKTPSTVQSKL